MKRQIIALLAGAALLATPLMTDFASAHKGGGGGGGSIEKMAAKLNLTANQKTQLEAIRTRTDVKIRAILTPEQQTKFDAAKAERQQRKAAMQANGGKRPEGQKSDKGQRGKQSLNLTDAQKTQRSAIREAAKAEMQSVLTPAQQAQMAQLKAQRQGGKGQRKAS